MASPASPNDTTGKDDEKWTPYQRPGKLGVDYDEYGAEMAPNARIWKRYVEETDKMDKELVDGWNKTLDVILIFAALFSAISTAFVIESSKDLKPDYTETSAKTLEFMSQTLSAIARGSAVNETATASPGSTDFTPTASAVVVNALWFLSLSLSVAVSLIAILAKEWCHSFMSGRVGTMLRQARLRQQRWDGIEQWKMKEILYVLPLLMHTALLLFAVGLSVYLWSINIGVALPVVITTALAVLFYAVTVSLPLFFRFCPYSTALLRFLYPYWIKLVAKHWIKDSIKAFLTLVAWVFHGINRLKQLLHTRKSRANNQDLGADDVESARQDNPSSSFSFRDRFNDAEGSVDRWIALMQGMFLTDRSQLVEQETPMDNVTSSMIGWMIANCEDSKSVDMALQAIAGANVLLLPRHLLWECGAMQLLVQRIKNSGLSVSPNNTTQEAYNTLLDEMSLFSRSLSLLTAFVQGEGLDFTSTRFISKGTRGAGQVSEGGVGPLKWCIIHDTQIVLKSSWASSPRRYELVAFELNGLPVEAGSLDWSMWNLHRNQCPKQWELLQHITTGHASYLPPKALLSLVNGITKSYLYDPSQSPIPLVQLLNMLSEQESLPSDLRWAVTVCLVVAAFANNSYTSGTNEDRNDSSPHMMQSKAVYHDLAARTPNEIDSAHLLMFGVLELLRRPKRSRGWQLSLTDLKSIHLDRYVPNISDSSAYRSLFSRPSGEFEPGVPFEPLSHITSLCSAWLDPIVSESESTSEFDSLRLAHLDVLLLPTWLNGQLGKRIMPDLVKCFAATQSPELKRRCLVALHYALPVYLRYNNHSSRGSAFKRELAQTAFLGRLLEFTQSTNRHDLPYAFNFIWVAAVVLGSDDDVDLLKKLQEYSAAPSIDNAIPRGPHELGLADLWRRDLEEMCRSDPQDIRDSGILDRMLVFYRRPNNRGLYPTNPPDTRTWHTILRDLEWSCEQRVYVARNAETNKPDNQTLEQEMERDAHEAGEITEGPGKMHVANDIARCQMPL